MTQFALVAPLEGLHQLAKANLLGHYQLLIAPIVLGRPTEYHEFFRKHNDQQIIMDNGVIERGRSMDAHDLYSAVQIVDAQLVVMPDAIDNADETVKQTAWGLREYRALDHATDTMGVVQGTTFEECLECARHLMDLGVDWLGVPRGLTKNLGSRVPLVLSLASECGLPMHVLGFSDNIEDDLMAAAAHRSVRGIDAATPSWATEWLPTRPPTDSRYLGKRPTDFWNAPLSVYAEYNIQIVHRWLTATSLVVTERNQEWESLTHLVPGQGV